MGETTVDSLTGTPSALPAAVASGAAAAVLRRASSVLGASLISALPDARTVDALADSVAATGSLADVVLDDPAALMVLESFVGSPLLAELSNGDAALLRQVLAVLRAAQRGSTRTRN